MSTNILIIGIDEVGRGCLAGPVVASACILNNNFPLEILNEIKDSKIISKKKREQLAEIIKNNSKYATAEVSCKEIDEINILQASLKAMKLAWENLEKQLSANEKNHVAIMVDGNKTFSSNYTIEAIVKGDSKIKAISASSIIAKTYRDDIMSKLGELHPEYAWNKNAGYGTKQHLEAISLHGITRHHRMSFAPIKCFLNK